MDAHSQSNDISPIASTALIVTSGASALINIVFIVVCSKTLKKTFHNLVILSLCISDLVLNMSLICVGITALSEFWKNSVGLCLFQVCLVFWGIVATYNLVSIICYERLLVVQSMNYGTCHFLDRFKYVIVGSTLGFDLLFITETILLLPHNDAIEFCSPMNLFGTNYAMFAKLLAVSVSGMIIFIVITTIRTSVLIWQMFFKTGNENNFVRELHESKTRNTERDGNSRMTSEQLDNPSTSNIYHTYSETWEFEDLLSIQQANIDQNNTLRYRIRRLIRLLKLERHGTTGYLDQNNEKSCISQKIKAKERRYRAWESRAFVSSVIISFETISLTLPFIMTFWCDLIDSSSSMSKETRAYLIFPLVIYSILNPFIYVWCVPDIKKELKKICRRAK